MFRVPARSRFSRRVFGPNYLGYPVSRRGTDLGLLSFLFAVLAVVLAVSSVYFESIRGAVNGYVLNWFAAHGFVRTPDASSVLEMRNPSAFLFTDPIVIRWLTVHAWWFAACAMLLSIWAEANRETTTFLSAGFVIGAMALLFFSPVWSIGTMIAGWSCVAWLRSRA